MAGAHLGRQVHDAFQQRRGHEGGGATVASDEPQRLLGIELAHHHDGLAEEMRVEREAAGRRVIERPGHEVHVGGLHAVQRDHARDDRARIDRPAQRPLRLARRAGGVDHRAAQSGRLSHGVRPPGGDEVRHVRGPRAPLATEQHDVPQPRRAGADPLQHRDEGVAGKHRDRVGVVQDVGDLLGGEAVIHGHRDEAERAGGGGGQQHLERVVRVEHHVLAGHEAEIAQGVGQAVARLVVLVPGEPVVAVDHRHLVGLGLGVPGHDVHSPRILALAGYPLARDMH